MTLLGHKPPFLSGLANINIPDNDIAWAQASLPVGSGGLGVRSATQLAPSAFLASAAGCGSITQELIPPRLWDTAYHTRDDILQVWREGLDVSPPLAADASRQKAWDAPRVAASFKALQEATQDTPTQAHLLAASRKESGAWLQTLPVSSLGLRMEDNVFRVATGLRLGVPIFRWRFDGETQQRCWGHLHQQNLISSTLSNSYKQHVAHASVLSFTVLHFIACIMYVCMYYKYIIFF